MEQMTLVTGIVAMAAGAALFSIGMYGWRPVSQRAGGFFETPAALAGGLAWLVRIALRPGGAVRPRTTAVRELDITPQCAPLASTVSVVAVPAPVAPAALAAPASASTRPASRKRTGKRSRSGVRTRATGSGSRSST